VYRLVPDRCVAEFVIKQMTVKTARGRLAAIDGELRVDETDPAASRVWVRFDATSFTTGSVERDEAVCGEKFLDVTRFPEIRFESTRVDETGPGRYTVTGDLEIKGTARPVELESRVTATGGRVAVEGTTIISREAFGLGWQPNEFLLADTVKIFVAAEFG
jgi:polyisoprenoid-binding protein YceI